MIEENYLNLNQLSVYSGLGVRTLRELLKHPEHPLPHFRVNKKTIRIARADFDEWITVYRIDSADEIAKMVDSVVNDMANKF